MTHTEMRLARQKRALHIRGMLLKGMSCSEVAKRLGVSRQRVNQLATVPRFCKCGAAVLAIGRLCKACRDRRRKDALKVCVVCGKPRSNRRFVCSVECQKVFSRRYCPHCKRTLPLDEFYWNKGANDYYNRCRACHQEACQSWKERHKERWKEILKAAQKRMYARRKAGIPGRPMRKIERTTA